MYYFNALTNISEVAEGKRGRIEEIRRKQHVSGFNSIFAVAPVQMAKLYYKKFQQQMGEKPEKRLRVTVIFSYGANEGEEDGSLDEKNPEDTITL